MIPKPELHQPSADLALRYPEQAAKMKGYLRKHGVPEGKIEDIASEAWTGALETYDQAHGLDMIQWAWYILQHNALPQYGRDAKASKTIPLEEDPPDEPEESPDETQTRLIAFLRSHLPNDLRVMFDAIKEVTSETDSQHIYDQVAARLNVPMKQCRTMVKRLKRTCSKLLEIYNP